MMERLHKIDGKYAELHALTQLFAVRAELSAIVILSRDYETAIAQYPPTARIYILHGKKTINIKPTTFPPNVVALEDQNVSSEFLKNKAFLCVDYLETKRYLYSTPRLLKFILKNSAISIISAQKKSSWDAKKNKRLFGREGSALVGSFMSNLSVGIGGILADVHRLKYPKIPILAVVTQYNEGDIIEPVIDHLLSQGVDVHVIDNWSDDGSFELVQDMATKNPERVSLERFPVKNTGKYEWKDILKRVTEVGKSRPRYKWVISNDADEIRWSPWPRVSLQHAISFIDYLGYNTLDYTVFNFLPTNDGFNQGMNPLKFFKYGDFGHEGWHFMQLKTWKNLPEAEIASSGGHLVKLPESKIFPLKFLIGHYSLRSDAQARKKIFKDRVPRFLKEEKNKGWHSHYDNIETKESFLVNKDYLIKLYIPPVFVN